MYRIYQQSRRLTYIGLLLINLHSFCRFVICAKFIRRYKRRMRENLSVIRYFRNEKFLMISANSYITSINSYTILQQIQFITILPNLPVMSIVTALRINLRIYILRGSINMFIKSILRNRCTVSRSEKLWAKSCLSKRGAFFPEKR